MITTHSPILIKQLVENEYVKVLILNKDITYSKIWQRELSYNSANEINYLAFNLATEEYHNELYEKLKNKNGANLGIKDFDTSFFINSKSEAKIYPRKGNTNEVSIHTFIRNQIHHQADNGKASIKDLENSIKIMRAYL